LKDTLIISVSLLIVLGAGYFIFRELSAPTWNYADPDDPISIISDPVQSAPPDTLIPLLVMIDGRYTLTPQAAYSISGQIVSRQRYLRGFMSKLSPWDYAIAWGDTDKYLHRVEFRQMVRFCLFKPRRGMNVDFAYVQTHISNNHLIPANANIRKALSKAHRGDKVQIRGMLVNVIGSDKNGRNSTWNTSLSRADGGNGACEIVYITGLRINNQIYE